MSLTNELAFKIQLKHIGADDFTAEAKEMLADVETRLSGLDATKKDEKRRISALTKDKSELLARIAETDTLLASIGNSLTDTEAKQLILKKLYDLATQELSAACTSARCRV